MLQVSSYVSVISGVKIFSKQMIFSQLCILLLSLHLSKTNGNQLGLSQKPLQLVFSPFSMLERNFVVVYIYFDLHFLFLGRNLNKGINRFRQILKAVEVRTTQNIRTTIARELAEVLLRAVCQHAYTPPSLENREEKPENQHRRSSSLGGSLTSLRTSSSKGSLKPKMYTTER